jgi:hypothetical protein
MRTRSAELVPVLGSELATEQELRRRREPAATATPMNPGRGFLD